jgi:hypothetical protein
MATRLPIDGASFALIGTGKFRAVPKYAELADGSRRSVPGSQADIDGVPLWTVDVIIDDDDSDRSEAVAVKVTSHNPPEVAKFRPITFTGLTCMPYLDRRTNRVALSFTASGIANGSGGKA